MLPSQLAGRLVAGEGGCLLWTGTLNDGGYGVVKIGGREGPVVRVHRIVYELLVGPIPDGHELHHRPTCPKRCANPEHVTPLAKGEHTREHGLKGAAKSNAAKTTCPRGHELTRTARQRRCYVCGNAQARDRRRRRKEGSR